MSDFDSFSEDELLYLKLLADRARQADFAASMISYSSLDLSTYGEPPKRRVEIHFDGRVYLPFENDPEWPSPGLRVWQREAVKSAEIREGGQVLRGRKRQRIVDLLDGKFDGMPPVFDPTASEWAIRSYIHGLMNHGTVPAFVAPKGWGKTKLVLEVAAALVIPGHRLLSYFEEVQVSEEERAQDVWLFNPETSPGVVHAELLSNGLTFGYRDGVPCYFHDPDGAGEPDPSQGVLIVEHLVMTSATEFDLTDDVRYEFWAVKLTEFVNHRIPPLTVIADGVTAILGNNTSRYGAWTSRFKALLKECGIPNGLGVLHSPMGVNTNTPMHGIESMAEWDGLWLGSSPAFPIRPEDKRYVETFPRLGDPRVPLRLVVMDDDGRLSLKADSKPHISGDGEPDYEELLLGRLRDASEPLWTRDVCPPGDDYKQCRAALEKLRSEGKVIPEKVAKGRTRGTLWSLPETDDGGDGDDGADGGVGGGVAAGDRAEGRGNLGQGRVGR